jgi:uncharacterized protein
VNRIPVPEDQPWKDSPEGCLLFLKLQPKASKSCLVGVEAGRLKIKITAAPVDGEANAALCKFLSKVFKVAPSRIRMIRGEAGREKTLEVLGMQAAEVQEKILIHLQD